MSKRWALVVLAGCGSVIKPPEPDRRLKVETAGTMFDSNGGYRFAALPEPGAGIVRLDVRYPVGSADDPPGKEGLAHLVEHLLFDVELPRPSGKTSINAELGRVALWWNAETGRDYTTYQVVAVPGELDDLIGLEVDRLATGCGGLTPEIFAREREVVLDELRERQGASGASIERAIYEQAYPAGHPYRAVDSVETVSKLDFKDVCDFLAGPYHRGQAVVIASGMVDAAALQKAASHHFGRLHPRSTEPRPAVAAADPGHGTVHVRADVDEPELVALFSLPPETSHDYRMLELVWDTIPYRLSAFGFIYKWGHSADYAVIGGPRAPVLAVSVTLTSPDKLDDAIDAMDKSLAFAKRALGPERDSRAWQASWQAEAESLLSQWESLNSRNALFADLLDFDPHQLLVGRIQELTNAGPDDVKTIADRWLTTNRARYVLLEPSGASGGVAGGKTYKGGAADHPTHVDPSLADQPLPVPRTRLAIDTEEYKLPNGLTVVLWPNGGSPLVHGRLVVDSGSVHDPAGKEGVSELVGANTVNADTLVFSRADLSTRVDELVVSLTSKLRTPSYDLDDDAKKFMRGRLNMERAKERADYVHDLAEAVYGTGHPYARPPMTAASLDQIHADLVTDWARAHIVPNNATLILAGQFDAGLIGKYIKYYAEAVSGGRDSEDATGVVSPGRRYVRGVEAKPSPTVELDVAFAGGRGLDASYAKRLVLAAVVESKLTSLRSQKALTYGFSATYTPRVAGGMWLISGRADASRAAEAATAVAKIFAEIRRDPESYLAEFVLARQKVLENLLAGVADSREIANRLALLARFHAPDNFYDKVARAVATMTLKDLPPLVQAELPANHQVFGAFGNEEAVDAAVDAAHHVE